MFSKRKKNSICLAKGFKSAAIASGLKKNKKPDLALIYSEVPAAACGMFTKNRFAAASVRISREHLKTKKSQAIVANSGNANCYTGKKGLMAARETVRLAAGLLGLRENLVLVASTGIIGKQLDFAKIKNSLPLLVSSLNSKNGAKVARAIMTTDTRAKELAVRINVGNKVVTLGATAKGAGMIAPDMACTERTRSTSLGVRPEPVEGRSRSATMLCFITTDASIQYFALKAALQEAVESSFNMISIDGCMSTNDSVIILANGLAKNNIINLNDGNFHKFKAALREICLGLAKMIVQDAEGASKFITIKISGAKTDLQAKKAALSIANSNLFKTAAYGQGQNWGRVIAAIGASGAQAKEGIKLYCSSFKKKDISVKANLRCGKGTATVYTSDLTPEYVRINAEYS